MNRTLEQTIGIYAGDIPSTTFIENLIEGMAEEGKRLVLFGNQKKPVSYKGDVKIVPTPSGNVSLMNFVMKQSLKLYSRDKRKSKKLWDSVRSRSKSKGLLFRRLGIILPILNTAPDVLHIQWAKSVHFNPELFDLFDGKIALSLRGAHINYSPLNDPELADSYRKYFPKVSLFHAVSEAIASEAQKYGAVAERMRVIYTSVRDDLLERKTVADKDGDTLRIISVGRFHWKKGYHYALDTMKLLKDSGLKFRYDLIAQGNVPEEIIFLINEYGLKNEVRIIPGMEYDKLIDHLQNSDVLILPSVEEGIANVVLEAMAVGVPVVTTDCGGMSEAVEDGLSGYVTKVREPEHMAQKILQLAQMKPEDLNTIKGNARKSVRDKFSRSRQMNEFASFYNELAA